MAGDIIVLKFGGSVLRSQADVPTAVHEIYRWYRAGWRVVAIASTLGESAELAAGEQGAAALLGAALDRVGVPASIVDPRELGPMAACTSLDSGAAEERVERLKTLLRQSPVLVLPAFGHEPDSSDHSAVLLAHALRANRCRLLKDVDGVYESDPATAASNSSLQRFSALGYADALELATTLIQPKAVQLLDRYSVRAEVAAVASPYESVIGRFSRTPAHSCSTAPTAVLILGLGEIGRGVHRRVAAMSEHFVVNGAFIRDRCKHTKCGSPLFDSVNDVMSQRPDVVIDTLPGLEPAHSLVSHFLERGVSIVTANVSLIAEAGRQLSTLAARCNAYLYYSASVGGSAPMLEALRREMHHHDVRSIAAVFSDAANHALDRCAQGLGLNVALLNTSSESGEARAHEELSGAHSVRKLRLLTRHAFGREPDALHVVPLDAESLARARDALTENCTLRWVGRAWKISHSVFAQLQLEALDRRDPLAQVPPEWNRLLITRSNGQEVVIHGRGTGCWPTTEALMADLLDVRFAHLALARAGAPPR
jgi:homoserine dehydrogenase